MDKCASGQALTEAEDPLKDRQQISFIHVLIALAAHWKLIASSTLAALCLGIALAFLLPAKYTATTVLLPPQDRSGGSMLMQQLGALGSMASAAGGGLGVKDTNDLYVSLLKTEPVENSVIGQFGLKAAYHAHTSADARKALEKHVDITNGAKDGLIRIAVLDKDPQRAAGIANGYVTVFQQYSQDKAISEASQRRTFFAKQLVEAKDNLDTAETALKQVEQNKGVVQMSGQSMALIQSAASLRAQIAAKEVEVRAMRSYAGEKNANLMMAEQQLAGWQAQLERLTSGQAESSDGLMPSGDRMPELQLTYAKKVRDVKYYETIFDILARQFESAKLDEARQGTRIQVMAAASAPDKPSGPPRLLIAVAAMFAGLVLACLYAVFSEGWRGLRSSPEHWASVEQLILQFRKGSLA